MEELVEALEALMAKGLVEVRNGRFVVVVGPAAARDA